MLEAIAGKRQGQIIAATLDNFEAATKAMDEMADSAGDADNEMAIITESAEYKLNRLKQTGVGIAQNVFDSDMVKGSIDGINKFAEAIDFLTKKIGLLGTIGLVGGSIFGIKNLGKSKMFDFLKCAEV